MRGEFDCVLPREEGYYLDKLRKLHLAIRSHVYGQMRGQDPALLREVAREAADDTIFRLDEGVERIVLDYCADWGAECPFVLVAEGIEGGRLVFPTGHSSGDAEFVLIMDPVDGTRPLMYDKRSGWTLSAVAVNHGIETTSDDIVLAVQTELPTSRQYMAVHLWAVQGQGYWAENHDLIAGKVAPMQLRPSQARTMENGFGGFVKFFPAGKLEAAQLEQALWDRLGLGSAAIFDDQYISTGGQLYQLMAGHDRFVADIRPALHGPGVFCSHPYDICTALIAQSAGVVLTDLSGGPLTFPLDTSTNVGWVGYANDGLRDLIQRELMEALE